MTRTQPHQRFQIGRRQIQLARWTAFASLPLMALSFITSATESPVLYHEQYRPQIHYSPPANWMNDPNGLIRADGVSHLYFQYNPDATVWGPMHWGHATSPDFLHWHTEDIALVPDDFGTIFSGSVVLDRLNTAKLGRDGRNPLVAIFTYHNHAREKAGAIDVESQGLAYSLDNGRSYTKAPLPIIRNPGKRDYRDPQVQWNAQTQRWILTLVATDHVEFYSSGDLFHWKYESDFASASDPMVGVWECPNLVRVVGADDHMEHDILLVSVSPNPPIHRGGVRYFTGHFDGHRFVADLQSHGQWIDVGPDFYAGAIWNRDDAPIASAPILQGWMNNWLYATKVPTSVWRGVMAIPREITLRQVDGRHLLETVPVSTLASQRRLPAVHATLSKKTVYRWTDATGEVPPALDIEVDTVANDSGAIELILSNSFAEQIVVKVDEAKKTISLDRSQSGTTNFDERFGDLVVAPIPDLDRPLKVRILLDQSSIEIFVNDGRVAMTAQVFPTTLYDRFALGPASHLAQAEARFYRLDSIWSAPTE